MFFSRSITRSRKIWLVGILSLAVTAGCSGVPVGTSQPEMAPQSVAETAADTGLLAESEESRGVMIPEPDAGQSPRLVKNASLRLELDDVDEAIAAISTMLGQYQGDLLHLSDQDSDQQGPRHVSLQLRVPQNNLEATLKALRGLGTVVNQSISAEDVSTQLVDLQARIRNLRQSEQALQEIMERSGSIAEVLDVAQELSTVREAIERHAAQLNSLQNRVAYSTISLTLVSTQPTALATSPVGETLNQTWQTATTSVKTLSVALLRLALWLLAFSPYIGLLVLAGWVGRHYWQRDRRTDEPVSPN